MKKTIFVSALTALITVILSLLVIHFICDNCDEEECDQHEIYISKHAGHGQDMVWHGDHKMGCAGMSEECKTFRAEFDKELSDEEKATIIKVKESFEALKENKEIEDHEQVMKDHKADFETLEAIAENHKESLDAIMAKCHKSCEKKCEGEKKEECKKKCEGEAKVKEECEKKCEGEAKAKEAKCKMKCETSCKKKCEGSADVKFEKKVEVIIITEDDEEGEGEVKERKVMMFSGDHSNMCRVHFLLMDF